jgi:hypothetical protein
MQTTKKLTGWKVVKIKIIRHDLYVLGCDIAQAVSRRLPTAAARVRAQVG